MYSPSKGEPARRIPLHAAAIGAQFDESIPLSTLHRWKEELDTTDGL